MIENMSWTVNYDRDTQIPLRLALDALKNVEEAAALGHVVLANPFEGTLRFDWDVPIDSVPGSETDPETPRGKFRTRVRRAYAEAMLCAPDLFTDADYETLKGWGNP